jgi:hypothetical protein
MRIVRLAAAGPGQVAAEVELKGGALVDVVFAVGSRAGRFEVEGVRPLVFNWEFVEAEKTRAMVRAVCAFALGAWGTGADCPPDADMSAPEEAAAVGSGRTVPADARARLVELWSAGIGRVLARVRLGDGRVADARFETLERAYLVWGPGLGFWGEQAAAGDVAAIKGAVDAFDLVAHHWPMPGLAAELRVPPAVVYFELGGDRVRGRPWPPEGWRSEVWGEDGWCRVCGTPNGPQTGRLTLDGRGMRSFGGWWPVSWRDGVCLVKAVADAAVKRFGVEVVDVVWRGKGPGPAAQLVVPVSDRAWFDPERLDAASVAAHSVPGVVCPGCGVKRWKPLAFNPPPGLAGRLPEMVVEPDLSWGPVAASPEWFGDGLNSYRQILVRSDFGEFLGGASTRDFRMLSIDPVRDLM